MFGVDGCTATDAFSRLLASNHVSLGCFGPISVGFVGDKVTGTGVTLVLYGYVRFTNDRTLVSFMCTFAAKQLQQLTTRYLKHLL